LILLDKVKVFNEWGLLDDLQQLVCVDRVVTFFDVECKVCKFRAAFVSPLQDESVDFLLDLSVVKDRKAQLIPEVVFHISEHELSGAEDSLEGLLDGRVLFHFHFFVESDDGPESAFFGQDSEFAFREVFRGHTLDISLIGVEFVEIFLAELEDGQFGDENPKRLSVVKDSIGFFVLFSNVEMKLDDGNDDIVEDEAKDFGEDLLAAEDDLGFVFGVELETEPRDFEYIHTVEVIFHPEVFVAFHFDKILHHGFKSFEVLFTDHVHGNDFF
jgi:hypothetical protein